MSEEMDRKRKKRTSERRLRSEAGRDVGEGGTVG